MTNLDAKQEAIKNAYGEFWETVKDYVDGNGWCSARRSIGFEKIISKLLWQTKVGNQYLWRPSSLQGLENNNGWIKIESEADLPKENTWCFVISKISGFTHGNFLIKNKDFWLIDATHYQPIEKPKPPIY